MLYEKYCKQCGNRFIASRADAVFCSGKCTAQFYRENPNPDYIHAEKERVNWYTCDHCGEEFQVNDYAKREGKRRPRFCSNKCKQAAYRERVSNQAARRSEQTSRPAGNKAGSGQDRAKGDTRENNYPFGFFSGKAYAAKEVCRLYARTVLGVSASVTKVSLRKAWAAACNDAHPDKNPTRREWAEERMKIINRAYEILSA